MDAMTDIQDVTATMKPLTLRNLTPRQRRWALRHPVRTWRHTRSVNSVYEDDKAVRMTPQVAKALEAQLTRPMHLTWRDVGVAILALAIVLAPWVPIVAVVWFVAS